ncbi:metal-binding heat shock protein [Buchnera aphidicola (Aphis glycines)]|uniref:Endoribonuclease YbeY n=1 Tax=Buchnera aphidicola (Aphis glycines) TaxID=1265350 RepID=A0A0M4HB71_9GAMM|nr:rRNA maturation RNase YbeY [Buchnera aphidicola]ALD15374.1 metal-binding heat shock protein [Buchnera aphidicola (Aphis glycines)]
MKKKDCFILNIQINCKNKKKIPKKKMFERWIRKVLYKKNIIIITIRIVDEKEIKNLNFKYRGKNCSTNILSFQLNFFIQKNIKLLGDLVLCKKIIEKESIQYKTTLESRWAHMIIHGVLHLLGYDHKSYKEQKVMENIENKIMLSLSYDKPYY